MGWGAVADMQQKLVITSILKQKTRSLLTMRLRVLIFWARQTPTQQDPRPQTKVTGALGTWYLVPCSTWYG